MEVLTLCDLTTAPAQPGTPAVSGPAAGSAGPDGLPLITLGASPGAGAMSLSAAAVERMIVEDAAGDGKAPVGGGPIPAYVWEGRRGYLWPTAAGELCHAEYSGLGLIRGCIAAADLPSGRTPGPDGITTALEENGALHVFLADLEDVRSLSCNGTAFTVTEVGRTRTPEGTRVYYTLRTPWWPTGSMTATVLRAEGTTADTLRLGPDRTDDPRTHHCA
ncbi:hypothetical protein [Kitasatospora sp. NPDC051914]|uniref:hypothetical protein n=1 Tax=Kitasatospora sp. NPDC051914 TaxID=3154945 RepID=UPI0034271004